MSIDLNVLATVDYDSLSLKVFLCSSLLACFIPSSPLPQVLSMPSSNQGWPEEFGFQLGGNGPSYILSVEEGSSAHLAGLQAGDQVLEIEGHNVSTLGPQAVMAIAQTQKNIPPSIGVVSRIQQHETAAALIKASQGRTLRLGVLCLGPRQKHSISIEDSQMGGEGARLDRKHKALEFNRKVDQILGDEPEVKEKLFTVLKQYAAEKES
ncbi:Delphilin Glutamate receptor, ionotropic, delta 2-interacting protein 1 [Collichthys lucidus]|uniref:Delphilin Glutamate receptor, ionotropic, delta 2-interacting protein 1 n=1 Tax=Collichthys lucidus TaxID=240159 RepID=A0A4U5VNJ5_COLLU|nr:Delphilin Glutamate receptor, ionotropic, delta 2-interacting protein 1 [Collichthys lucidus]